MPKKIPRHTPRSILLTESPKILRSLTQILILGMLLWAVLLAICPWQQTSMGSGRVIAYSPTERQQSIDAPVDGRLGRWFVNEGSVVHEGDPIVEINDIDPEYLSRLEAEKHAIQARVGAAQLSVQTAKLHLDRQAILSKEGLSSRRSYELSKLEYAKFLTDVANANAELAKIQTRLARQATQFVKAPRSGTILRRTAGERSVLVKAGESIAVIVPSTESRAVELWVNGNDISLVTEGQKARLQFEGWPAIQFSGWPSVAVGTFSGTVAVIDAADNGVGQFRVLIIADNDEPWPASHYLRQGVRAQGWLLLGQVKLGYELWRRFNGFPPVSSVIPGFQKSQDLSKKK